MGFFYRPDDDESTVSQVQFPATVTNTGMGDCLGAGKPPPYFTKPPRPTQPPTLSGTRNDYQPKCSDALRMEVKGMYGSFGGWQVQLCDPSLTRGTPEHLEMSSS